jgi:hypothetical protein
MYRLAAILILTLLQGCSEISRYYIPEAPRENVQLHPGGSCGAPDATYIFNLVPGIDGFISARVGKEGWGLYYGFSIAKGSKMQVIDPIFKIRDVDSGNEIDVPMQEFRLSVYGGLPGRPAGYFEKYAAGTELTYTALNEALNVDYLRRDSFQSGINIKGLHPSAFELTIPALRANGISIESKRVRFRYTEKKYILSCLQ